MAGIPVRVIEPSKHVSATIKESTQVKLTALTEYSNQDQGAVLDYAVNLAYESDEGLQAWLKNGGQSAVEARIRKSGKPRGRGVHAAVPAERAIAKAV